jgi:hypothetical protein
MTVLLKRILVLTFLLALPGLAPADGGGYRSKGEAASEARRQMDGRILSIKLYDRPPAPPEYRVKMLREGDVHLLRLPARRNGKGKGKNNGRQDARSRR